MENPICGLQLEDKRAERCPEEQNKELNTRMKRYRSKTYLAVRENPLYVTETEFWQNEEK